jgi:hypothetical protein
LAEDGSKFIDLTGYYDAPPYSGLIQSVNLGVGDYALTFWIGADQPSAIYRGPVSVEATVGGLVQDFTFTPAVDSHRECLAAGNGQLQRIVGRTR